jgi:hypothetical protein
LTITAPVIGSPEFERSKTLSKTPGVVCARASRARRRKGWRSRRIEVPVHDLALALIHSERLAPKQDQEPEGDHGPLLRRSSLSLSRAG